MAVEDENGSFGGIGDDAAVGGALNEQGHVRDTGSESEGSRALVREINKVNKRRVRNDEVIDLKNSANEIVFTGESLTDNLNDWFQQATPEPRYDPFTRVELDDPFDFGPTTQPIAHGIASFAGLGKRYQGDDVFGNPIVEVTKTVDPLAIAAGFGFGPIVGKIVDYFNTGFEKTVSLGLAQDIFGPKKKQTSVPTDNNDGDTAQTATIPTLTTSTKSGVKPTSEFEQQLADALDPGVFEFFKFPEFDLLSDNLQTLFETKPKNDAS